jgi:hypothetical protein
MGRTNVSADSTAEISEICATSRSAAMRGMRFLPKADALATTCEYAFAIGTTSAA